MQKVEKYRVHINIFPLCLELTLCIYCFVICLTTPGAVDFIYPIIKAYPYFIAMSFIGFIHLLFTILSKFSKKAIHLYFNP